MQWTSGLSHYLAKLMFKEWEKHNLVEWKANEETALALVHEIISADLNKEKELEKEVSKMLDDLEKSHTGQFERYKMHPLLKKELAKKHGVIL